MFSWEPWTARGRGFAVDPPEDTSSVLYVGGGGKPEHDMVRDLC